MAEPTVSVVIPVLNGAEFVDQSLGSVATQRRPPDEVIVVDDGSSDGSADVAERWTAILPIRVLRLPTNGGCWAARNAAIESTDADLIALLDIDDIWLPDHLAVLLEAYEERPGLITANALMWVEQQALGSRGWDDRRPVPSAQHQVEQLLLDNYVFVGTLFSRDLCRRVGGFRSFSVGCEDWDLWLRMAAAGTLITRTGLPTALYRLRGDSTSANDSLLDSEIEMLELFKREHDDPRWNRAADMAIERRRAKQHLRSSFEAAASGRPLSARLHAARSFRGANRDGRVAAMAMALMPKRALARRESMRHDPTRAVHR
jgi:glycosyltransferase involved in cell wall biosynthesis